MKKLLLINPVARKSGLQSYAGTALTPLGLSYVAAMTPDNYDIRIIDESVETLTYPDADIVGLTSYTAHVPRAYEIARIYTARSVPVIMGGIHVSMMTEEALQYCDSVVIGEAETVWPQVLADFENGSLKKTYSGPRPDASEIPLPRRDLSKSPLYRWDAIQTSRGCPMNCGFCSVTKFNGGTFRRRPVDDVIAELLQIEKKLVFISDDNIVGFDGKEWLYEFFSKIIEHKINKYFWAQASINFGEDKKLLRLAHRAGLRVVLIGIESIETETLQSYHKSLNKYYLKNNRYPELIGNIRRCGMAVLGCFILGADTDTLQSFDKTLQFVLDTKIDVLQITKPTPLPGTKFYTEIDGENRILNKNYPEAWREYRFTRMLFKPRQLTIDEVYEGFYYVKKHFYSLPVRLKRYLSTLRDTKSISTVLISILMDRSYGKIWKNSDIYREIDNGYLNSKFNLQRPLA